MAGRHILAVGPASGRGDCVVVEVLQQGPQPLDVRLVGCEGENPYVATLRQRDVPKLKQKFRGSNEDWAAVVSHFLLQQPVAAHLSSGVHLVYTLTDDLELAFRQDVQGIRIALGEIRLPRDDDFEFNPFDWAQVSAKAHAATLQELVHLKSQASGELDTIAKLNAQLDDFLSAKDEAEAAMLGQFMDLLNEKKRKIRDQGRLLGAAHVQVQRSAATAVQSARKEPRQSKRKAAASEERVKEEEQEDVNEEATPEPSDAETDDEEAKSTAPSIRSSSASQADTEKPQSDGKPPPKRELPFGRPATRSQPPAREPSPAADEDDDTEDEEL